jgi:hypothetical protein
MEQKKQLKRSLKKSLPLTISRPLTIAPLSPSLRFDDDFLAKAGRMPKKADKEASPSSLSLSLSVLL